MLPRLNDIVAITGASSGIGEALAREFHRAGYNLILIARREDRLKKLAQQLETNRIDSVSIMLCDLSKREETKALACRLAQIPIAGLVNNAGRGSIGSFCKLDLDSELNQIELNVNAPLILTHAVVSRMKEFRSGFIVNVSSIMAYQAAPYVATYAATKAFEWYHSLALSRELEDNGLKILTLCPGPTDTEFFGVAKVTGRLSMFKRVSAESVAKACIEALKLGKRICIPNYQALILVYIAKLMPTQLYTYLVKKSLSSKVG